MTGCIGAVLLILFPDVFPVFPRGGTNSSIVFAFVLIVMILWVISIENNGQTLGKKITGIQVIDKHSKAPVGVIRLYIREVLKYQLIFIFLLFYICGISLLDKFMETQVVLVQHNKKE